MKGVYYGRSKENNKGSSEKASAAEETKTTKAAAAKKTSVKKTTTAAKKETIKEEPVKEVEKVEAAVTEKNEIKATVNFQFNGKSYSPEDLMKICKDVWKFDLNGKEEDLKSVELYVKPEENITYYVINGDVNGSFFI